MVFKKGIKHSEEHSRNIALALKGRKLSDEHKRNLTKAKKHWKITNGYKNIYLEDTGKYVKEHQLIWCQNNNMCFIPFGTVIHHIDGNKLNNNINNLILLDNKTHISVHKTGQVEWMNRERNKLGQFAGKING